MTFLPNNFICIRIYVWTIKDKFIVYIQCGVIHLSRWLLRYRNKQKFEGNLFFFCDKLNVIQGVIMCAKNANAVAAFCNIYNWKSFPLRHNPIWKHKKVHLPIFRSFLRLFSTNLTWNQCLMINKRKS